MPTIHATRATSAPRTTSAIPTPRVSIVCYNDALPEICTRVSVDSTVATTLTAAATDPAYIEVDGYEQGAAIELINKSQKPNASFAHDKVTIKPDHIIPKPDGTFKAIVLLDSDEMKAAGIAPGDLVKLRQTVGAQSSLPTDYVLVDPDLDRLPDAEAVHRTLWRTSSYAGTRTTSSSRIINNSSGRFRETTTTTSTSTRHDSIGFRAHTVRFGVETRNGMLPAKPLDDVRSDARFLLEGLVGNYEHMAASYDEALRDGLSQYGSQAVDTSRPTIDYSRLALKKSGDTFTVVADEALEPQTEFILVNIRTKQKVSVKVDDTSASLDLPAGTLPGDDIALYLAQDEDRAHTRKDRTFLRNLMRVGNGALEEIPWDLEEGSDYKTVKHFADRLVETLDLPGAK